MAALALCACEKKIAAEAEPPRPAESVPISNNPAHGAAMIGAARAAADKVDAANSSAR